MRVRASWGAWGVALAAVCTLVVLPVRQSRAADGPSTTFDSAGVHEYVVPEGASAVRVQVFGAQGNSATRGSASGGLGGAVTAVIDVSPGDSLQVMVGAQGGGGAPGDTNWSYYTAGAGGAASDVRAGSCAADQTCGLSDRVAVGGGGGGAGSLTSVSSGEGNHCGGGGGAGADGSGGAGCDSKGGYPWTYGAGAGGTASAGGAGGTSSYENRTAPNAGAAGVSGLGGKGGGETTDHGGGGGGGNGYYGGGGGGGGDFYRGAGGGGGSSWVSPSALLSSLDGATEGGDGRVIVAPLEATTASSVSLAVDDSSPMASESHVYTATVSPVPASGTVAFTANLAAISGCTAVPVNTTTGIAQCTTMFATVGAREVRVGFSGNASLMPSRSGNVTATVVKAVTATSVTSSKNPEEAQVSVTYTATVTPAPSGGTVDFTEDGTTIAGCGAVGVNTTTGVATCSRTYPSVGTKAVVAAYSGNTDYETSTSSTLNQQIVATLTSTSLATLVNPAALGQRIVFTATVSPVPDGGTMSFTADGTTISGCGSVSVNTSTGKATCAVVYQSEGTRVVVAAYSGNSSFGTSTSASLSQGVQAQDSVWESPGDYVYVVPAGTSAVRVQVFGAAGSSATRGYASGGLGGAVTAVVDVSPGDSLQVMVGAQGGGGAPGDTNWSYYTAGAGGAASDVRAGSCAATLSCGLSDRIVVAGGGGGAGSLTSVSSGEGNHCGGGGGAGADGSGGAGCDSKGGYPWTYGAGAGGTASAGGAGGTSSYENRTAPNAGAAGVSGLGGKGGGETTDHGGGGGGGNGYYGGGGGGGGDFYRGAGGGGGSSWVASDALLANFLGAIRGGGGKVVIETITTSTTSSVSLSKSASSIEARESLELTATVSPVPSSGTVLFTSAGAPISGCNAVPVSASTGVATCTTSYATVGDRVLRAGFSGNASQLPAQSSTTSVTVVKATTATAIASGTNPVPSGTPMTFTATVTPVPSGGTVNFTEDGTTISGCGAVGVDTTTGTATCARTYVTNGSRSIAAEYSGNNDYASSASATLTQRAISASTSVSLATSLTTAALGQQVVLTATVTPVPDGGTASFTDNGSTISGCSSVTVNTTSGVATCRVVYTEAGAHAFVAGYGGNDNYGASNSSSKSVTVSNVTATYDAAGSYLFKVPSNWSNMRIEAYGGAGSRATRGSASGGNGGKVRAILDVTAGTMYELNVGAQGGGGAPGDTNWSYYTAGAGGAASDVRAGSCAATLSCGLSDRIVVAGGGGGAGSLTSVSSGEGNHCGGGGGAGADGSGGAGCDSKGGYPWTYGAGAGGSPTAGGAGGTSSYENRTAPNAGAAGVSGLGGKGGGETTDHGGGGGGGNGYYGGGGGGGGDFYRGAGGGGGSSYITSDATTREFLGAVNGGNGYIVVTHAATNLDLATTGSGSLSYGATRTYTATFVDDGGNTVDSGPDSTLSVTFAKASGTATVSGLGTVTAVNGVATVTVTATATGTLSLSATSGDFASSDVSLTVVKADQNITFAQPTSPAAYDSTFSIAPTASSGLTVSVEASGGCSLSGSTVRMTSGTTSCTLTASQAGNGGYHAATDVVRTVAASKTSQASFSLSGVASATYGDSATFSTLGGSGTGAVTFERTSGTSCSIASSDAGSVTVDIVAGSGDCTITATKAADSDYAVVSESHTVSAQKKQLSVDAVADSKTYGETDPDLAATLDGFVDGESAASVAITGAASCSRSPGSGAGEYVISCGAGTLSASNYSFVAGSTAKFTVDKAELSVDAVADSKVYGESDPEWEWSFDGFVNGDLVSSVAITGAASCSRSPGSGAGEYVISCGAGTLSASNYSFVAGSTAVFTVDKADLTVRASSHAVAYLDAVPVPTASYEGFVNGDVAPDAAPSCSTVAVSGSDAGTYVTSCSGAIDSDYDITYADGTLTIERAEQVISFAQPPGPVTYGGSFQVSPSSTSFLPVTITPSAACRITAGTVTVIGTAGDCELTATQAGNGNYEPAASVKVSVATAKKSLSVDAVAAGKVYGADDPALTHALTGFVLLDSATSVTTSGTPACARTAGDNAGTYDITCAPGTLSAANYAFVTGATATFTIDKAEQVITFDAPEGPLPVNFVVDVKPTSSAGLPVSLVVRGGCTAEKSGKGFAVTLTGTTTTCTLIAAQTGDANHMPAASLVRKVDIQATAEEPSLPPANPDAIPEGGAVMVNADGTVTALKVETKPDGTVTLSAGSMVLSIAGLSGSPDTPPPAPGSAVTLGGDGFLAGSKVNVWVFSTPRLLGTATVNAQGVFEGSFTFPEDLPEGQHTLQMEGLDEDGVPRAIAVAVELAPRTDPGSVDEDSTSTTVAGEDPSNAGGGDGKSTSGSVSMSSSSSGWIAAIVVVLLLAATAGTILLRRRRRS